MHVIYIFFSLFIEVEDVNIWSIRCIIFFGVLYLAGWLLSTFFFITVNGINHLIEIIYFLIELFSFFFLFFIPLSNLGRRSRLLFSPLRPFPPAGVPRILVFCLVLPRAPSFLGRVALVTSRNAQSCAAYKRKS